MSDINSMESLARQYKHRDRAGIAHLEAVVDLLEKWGCDDAVTKGVAWGHDLLEDTKVSEKKIAAAGGEEILAGIKALTFMTRRDRAANVREDRSYRMSDAEFDRRKRDFLTGVRERGGVPLIVKLADRICTVEALAAEPENDEEMCRAIRYMRQAEDLFKGLRTALGDARLADKVEKSRMRVRALAGDRPFVETMTRNEFVEMMVRYGADHSDGYYQYTQWESLRKMMAGAVLADGQRHRVILLSNMKETNDAVESFWSPRDYVACFSYSKYEDVAMWLNYGRKRGYSSQAVRIHFDRKAVQDWIASHRKSYEKGLPHHGVYGVTFGNNREIVSSVDISADVERVCLADVGYIIHEKYLTAHHCGNVEYRRKFFRVENEGTIGWANAVYDCHQESELLPIFKKRGWAYEREVRLIVRLKKGVKAKAFQKIAVAFDGPFAQLEQDIVAFKSPKTEERVWRFPIWRGPWYDAKEVCEPIPLQKGSVTLASATPSDYSKEIKIGS